MRNIKRPIVVMVRGINLGTIEPPKVNGIPIYSLDAGMRGQRTMGTNEPMHVGDALNELWAEWRKAVPEPDTDDEFVLWLVEKKGWSDYPEPDVYIHEITA